MRATTVEKSSTKLKINTEIFLILLAIGCQFSSYKGLNFVKHNFDMADPCGAAIITSSFLFTYYIISFAGKVGGTYLFVKFAELFDFFTIMRLVAVVHTLVAIILFSIYLYGKDFYGLYTCLYLTRFLYSCVTFVIIILPVMYLFDKLPSRHHILIGTYIIMAKYTAKCFFRVLANCAPCLKIKFLYLLPVIASCLSIAIYSYLRRHSLPTVSKLEIPEIHPVSLRDKAFYVSLGAVWNIGFAYLYSFTIPYFKNISIIEIYNPIDEKFIFYLACVLSLYPAAKFCEKLGPSKMIIFSLFSMLTLGSLVLFAFVFNVSCCMLLLLLFSFFSACLFASILLFLYQFYRSTKSIFHTMFWFALGSSISKQLICFGSSWGFSHNFPLAGMWIFTLIVLMCLSAIFSNSRIIKSEREHSIS